ncbi:MAG: DNA polymerase III subunit alpha [bacterium JZ-2024 1]
MASDFVHLHLHTEYSLLDGLTRIPDLMERLTRLKMPAVALTDHGSMFAAIEFYEAAQKHNIKPILGCEIYFVTHAISEPESSEKEIHHLTVLAKNEIGYKNLIKLVTRAHLEGFQRKPRVDLNLLSAHRDGLIVLSGCESSPFSHYLLTDRLDDARFLASTFKDLFRDDFYIELQNHQREVDRTLIRRLKTLAHEINIPTVATNDVHYIDPQDGPTQEVLLAIQTNKKWDDPGRLKIEPHEYYLKDASAMKNLFPEDLDAVTRTLEVAEKCETYLDLRNLKPRYPGFEVPPEFKTADDYFAHLCRKGLQERLGTPSPEAHQRLAYEMSVIQKMGLSTYFLVVADFIRFARSRDIPVGPGRGSSAGSLVAFVLGITDVNPLQYDLLFERFLNPDRISLPDIDVDFCAKRRDEVIQYVRDRYGAESVAQISTFGTLLSRAAIRDVARIFGADSATVESIIRLVPMGISLNDALKQTELQRLVAENPMVEKILTTARSLEGTVRSAGIHAGGVVIADSPLTELVPLKRGRASEIVTQYPMESLEKIGLIKMDFLGLRNLTVIHDACRKIRERHNVTIDLARIPLNDPAAYRIFKEGDTLGIFQFESPTARRLCRDIAPTNISELAAVNALNRPGPLINGLDRQYIASKRSGKIQSLHPLIDPILSDTFGVMIYQEQLMLIAMQMGGLTPGEADHLRKAVGKKDAREMEAVLPRLREGALKRKVPQDIVDKVIKTMREFAEYGFNKSHSVAYALLAYQTAYLKAHYPLDFLACLLTSVMGTDREAAYIRELRSRGFRILPPDINRSEAGFTVEDDAIRTALSALKGVGELVADSITSERNKNGPYASLWDFCNRIDTQRVNQGVIKALILSGAFDAIHHSRRGLEMVLPAYLELIQRKKRSSSDPASVLFRGSRSPGRAPDFVPLPADDDYPPVKRAELEHDYLGFFLSVHPVQLFARYRKSHRYPLIANLLSRGTSSRRVTVLGYLSDLQLRKTKKGMPVLRGVLEDETASVRILAFAEAAQNLPEDVRRTNRGVAIVSGDLQVDLLNESASEESENLTDANFLFRVDSFAPVADPAEAKPTADSPPSSPVLLFIPSPDEKTLKALRAALNQSPGSARVILQFNNWPSPPLRIHLGPPVGVNPALLLKRLPQGVVPL